jgi:hypothetical protein
MNGFYSQPGFCQANPITVNGVTYENLAPLAGILIRTVLAEFSGIKTLDKTRLSLYSFKITL